MYDLSSNFNTFYKDHVVLPSKEQTRLRELKNINIQRLKEGLAEYNEEKGTSYKIVETLEQGSFAMSTVTQSDSKNYDIDVAIVLDKDNLPEGTTAVKNIIVNALKKKSAQFKTEPEFKTNCIRVIYQAGYHIDFAIYRRFMNSNDDYEYEHCGSEWRTRDPKAITKWFLSKIKANGQSLRKTVRLLKMFCKSRNLWVMPGGLMLSVLVEEAFTHDSRLDISFYETIKGTKERLLYDETIDNPVCRFSAHMTAYISLPMAEEMCRQYANTSRILPPILSSAMTVNVDKKNPQYTHANPCVYWG
ncbi:hypothetical protein JCM17380_15460 [Desulfosporosinus burensis]